ncbi:MAG: hypothetical protein RL380_18 [Verrucomicrobiota bacterium]
MTPLDAACYEYHCKVTEAEHKLIGAMEFLLKSRGAKRYHQLKETV